MLAQYAEERYVLLLLLTWCGHYIQPICAVAGIFDFDGVEKVNVVSPLRRWAC
jgi:membrane protein YqaA with SNARE-associated domain